MKIAIVGGTWFIGHAAAALAAQRGHDVFVLHRGRHASEVASVQPVLVDRADPSALCETLGRLAPDAFIDTRAMTRVEAEVTALAAKVLSLPVVVLSSQDVYAQFGRLNGLAAPPPEPIVTETSPLTVPYPFRGIADHEGGPDYDKKEVEEVFRSAVQDGAPAVTILRLCAVYGNRDPKRRFGALVDAFDKGCVELPCSGGAPLRLTHAHVEDVAHAIILATEKLDHGAHVYNVGEKETPTMRERVESIAREMGVTFSWRETEKLPDDLWFLGLLANDFVSDSSLIRSDLEYSEITTEQERLADTIDWLRQSRSTQSG